VGLMRNVNGYYLAETGRVLGDVTIGKGTSVWFGAVVRGDEAPITIGSNTNIQDNAVVHPHPGTPVDIGDDCIIGHNATVHCRKVGNGVLVGMGAVILDGTEIGDGCIIGAGAVVPEKKIVPPGSLVVGVPGRIIRNVSDDERAQILKSAGEYRKLAEAYVSGALAEAPGVAVKAKK
jgi:carbonic anhydrase/acetyltransferase-like protein (isoleucine patch superfamily)